MFDVGRSDLFARDCPMVYPFPLRWTIQGKCITIDDNA
jgi:hypothetical protein